MSLDLTLLDQLANSLNQDNHPEGDACLYCDPAEAREMLKRELPALIARIRELEGPYHRWEATADGEACRFCGVRR